ncbi:MAG: MBL fold metallo-hydrolase [Bacillota bacterium]|nr:MBL fold metallo-hydrolase [Bacillota bacterium]
MDFIVLASGSKGNATILKHGERRYLVDAGISLRMMQSRLSIKNDRLDRLDGIFVTHEHTDHISFLVALVNKFHCPVYLTEGTKRNLSRVIRENLKEDDYRVIGFDEPLLLEDFAVMAFPTYHDALEPCGFKFAVDGKTLVYMTDTGYFPDDRIDAIRNADAYILEANHDPEMLLESDRPWLLKRRILDDQGHLSNADSAFLALNLAGDRTRLIMLAHLSQECNTPEKALETYYGVFAEQGVAPGQYRIICALQNEPMEIVSL